MKKKVFSSGGMDGESRVEGYNYGKYPIHKFRGSSSPGLFFPLWPYACGMDEWRKECFRKRTFSDTFAVEYVQRGVFVFQQDDITMHVNPGEIFLVHLGRNSSMRCETAFATKQTIIMQGELLRSVLETLGLTGISHIVPREHERIDRFFDRIYDLMEDTSPEGQREISIACYALLTELAGQSSVLRHPEDLRRALEYIHSHLNEPLSLKELVRYSGVSHATLHRQFRKHLKTSPINYFLDRKLERARGLLENHLYSIKEVAEMMNYASPQYFASEFKKRYGVPPKNFKLKHTR